MGTRSRLRNGGAIGVLAPLGKVKPANFVRSLLLQTAAMSAEISKSNSAPTIPAESCRLTPDLRGSGVIEHRTAEQGGNSFAAGKLADLTHRLEMLKICREQYNIGPVVHGPRHFPDYGGMGMFKPRIVPPPGNVSRYP